MYLTNVLLKQVDVSDLLPVPPSPSPRPPQAPHHSTVWRAILTQYMRQELLSDKGRFYLVAIAQNNVQSILSGVREASENLQGTVCILE